MSSLAPSVSSKIKEQKTEAWADTVGLLQAANSFFGLSCFWIFNNCLSSCSVSWKTLGGKPKPLCKFEDVTAWGGAATLAASLEHAETLPGSWTDGALHLAVFAMLGVPNCSTCCSSRIASRPDQFVIAMFSSKNEEILWGSYASNTCLTVLLLSLTISIWHGKFWQNNDLNLYNVQIFWDCKGNSLPIWRQNSQPCSMQWNQEIVNHLHDRSFMQVSKFLQTGQASCLSMVSPHLRCKRFRSKFTFFLFPDPVHAQIPTWDARCLIWNKAKLGQRSQDACFCLKNYCLKQTICRQDRACHCFQLTDWTFLHSVTLQVFKINPPWPQTRIVIIVWLYLIWLCCLLLELLRDCFFRLVLRLTWEQPH